MQDPMRKVCEELGVEYANVPGHPLLKGGYMVYFTGTSTTSQEDGSKTKSEDGPTPPKNADKATPKLSGTPSETKTP